MGVPGGLPLGDSALNTYNSVVEQAILKALNDGGPDAVREFFFALIAEFGPEVIEHLDELYS
jgi:hypothetical protein